MKTIVFLFFLLGIPLFSSALDVDEKLTIRFLRISSTKKTVLVNRGLEDGLAVGDHAKFFVTTGVIARGLAVKVSPTRSIWSLYRVVDSKTLVADMMANIKIANPVRLSDDPSKSFYGDDRYSQISEAIPLDEGADDLVAEEDALISQRSQQEDFAFIKEDTSPKQSTRASGISKENFLEIFTFVNFDLLGSASDDRALDDKKKNSKKKDSVKETDLSINFSFGLEKYSSNDGPFKKFSFVGMLHRGTQESKFSSGVESSVSFSEYGVGVNYHFYGHPKSYGSMIGLLTLTGGLGTTKDSLKGEKDTDKTNEGALTFFSLGAGIKYFFSPNLGVRALLDYYGRNEKYAFEDTEKDYTRKTSGPRVRGGLSYRF